MSSITERIKERLDIVDYIGRHVPDLKKAGRLYKACCPFHGEKTPSFVVNPVTQTWRCFGACAEGGDVLKFAQKLHNWSFGETLLELGKLAGVEVRPQTPAQKEQDARLERLRGLLQTAADYYHQHLLSAEPQAQAALRYTREQRGFSDETIRQFGLGCAPEGWTKLLDALKQTGYSEADILEAGLATRSESGRVYDRFRHRLMIPIRDERGRVTGFGARALHPDDTPKYLNSPQSALFDKSKTLFGLDRARAAIESSGLVVIVEGYMDAIQAHQAGYANVVAQMGTALTETQLKKLVPRYTKKIIMALDADAAGQNATRRSLEVARTTLATDYTGQHGVDIRILHLEDAKDPDDILRETPAAWPALVAAARPAATFLIDLETATLPAGASIQERQAVAQRLLPLLIATQDNLYRRDNLQQLAVRLRLPEADVLAWGETLRQRTAADQRRRAAPPRPPANEQLSSEGLAYTGSSAPPPDHLPPYFPDSDSPPPPEDDDFYLGPFPGGRPAAPLRPGPGPSPAAFPAGGAALPSRHASRAAEGYCLRMLLQNPAALYAANRKLREIGQDHPQLPGAPLADLCEEDFSQHDYRLLFAALLRAVEQDDAEPLDYLRQSLESALHEALEQLLLDDDAHIQNSVNGRYSAEMNDILKKGKAQPRPAAETLRDFLKRLLQVRLHRLHREQQERYFLLQEARHSAESSEPEAQSQYHRQVSAASTALRLLQNSLHSI
ncbi:MAG: DNA primase [Anaerolineae bacterium]|nr:DNA primase [Anaerolineae bacterium]